MSEFQVCRTCRTVAADMIAIAGEYSCREHLTDEDMLTEITRGGIIL